MREHEHNAGKIPWHAVCLQPDKVLDIGPTEMINGDCEKEQHAPDYTTGKE